MPLYCPTKDAAETATFRCTHDRNTRIVWGKQAPTCTLYLDPMLEHGCQQQTLSGRVQGNATRRCAIWRTFMKILATILF